MLLSVLDFGINLEYRYRETLKLDVSIKIEGKLYKYKIAQFNAKNKAPLKSFLFY